MVGEGDFWAEWQALGRELGLGERLHWVGNVPADRLGVYYNMADALVMPSVTHPADGLNVTVLDAMSCARAVVGTSAAGNELAIRDGINGFLVPEGDDAALAGALVALAADPDLRARMGAAGRQRIETELGWPYLARRYVIAFRAAGRQALARRNVLTPELPAEIEVDEMSELLRFGLIGCGRVAPRHAQSIAELPGARLTAVADIRESRASRFAAEHRADQYTDYRRLLDRTDVDVVNICVPSGLHAEVAVDALEAGKHVIVEKPIALSLSDADRMIAAARSAGRKLCVVLQNRYNPPMQDLKRMVESGRLGRLLLGNATVRWYRPQEYYEDGWHGTWAMDGGALMNQSIHHIDALQWLLGRPESVFAYSATLGHRMEAEDIGVATIRFRGGPLGVVEGSTVTYPENLEGSVAIFGERGSLKVGGTALNRKVIWKIEGELEHEKELLTREQVDPTSVYGASHRAVIADMMEAILADRAPKTDGAEAKKSLALVLAMYESARTGQPVELGDGIWGLRLAGLVLAGREHPVEKRSRSSTNGDERSAGCWLR